jgi:hypothetical protein
VQVVLALQEGLEQGEVFIGGGIESAMGLRVKPPPWGVRPVSNGF